jgi:hypothetical protein
LLEDVPLVAAVGIDGEGRKHPLGLVEGATENASVVQALLDELVKRGLDPSFRRVCRSVKRWRDATMALRWTAAAMLEAAKGLRRLKAKSLLPQLRAALSAHRQKPDGAFSVAQTEQAASCPPPARRSRFSTSRGTSLLEKSRCRH